MKLTIEIETNSYHRRPEKLAVIWHKEGGGSFAIDSSENISTPEKQPLDERVKIALKHFLKAG